MSRTLQAVMTLATVIFLAAPALSQAANSDEQDAEVRFGIKLTAALNNDREAQFLVAQMYEQGVGTPQNLRMAHLWYTKSAKQGYAPAVEKLENWEKARQESESLAQERAEQQKRRQAEAEAAAAKAAREEATAKAAQERAEQQKRRQAEAAAAAAAAAKAAREEAAAKAARERAAEEQKRRQAEAAAAAATAKAASEEAAKTAKANEPPPVVKDAQSGQPKDKPKETTAKSAEKSSEEFRANPCNTPTAKFTSICQ